MTNVWNRIFKFLSQRGTITFMYITYITKCRETSNSNPSHFLSWWNRNWLTTIIPGSLPGATEKSLMKHSPLYFKFLEHFNFSLSKQFYLKTIYFLSSITIYVTHMSLCRSLARNLSSVYRTSFLFLQINRQNYLKTPLNYVTNFERG